MKGWFQSLIVGPFKALTLSTAVVFMIAGGAAAATFVYFVFVVLGTTLGFTIGGAPVIVDSYHTGQAQMEKLVASKEKAPAKKSTDKG